MRKTKGLKQNKAIKKQINYKNNTTMDLISFKLFENNIEHQSELSDHSLFKDTKNVKGDELE